MERKELVPYCTGGNNAESIRQALVPVIKCSVHTLLHELCNNLLTIPFVMN